MAFVFDFYRNVVDDTKSSFINSAVTSSFNLITESVGNFFMDCHKSIKETIENVQYQVIYSSVTYLLKFISFNSSFRDNVALFITSVIIGLRNGTWFALKNGFMAILLQKVYNILDPMIILSKLIK
ncbi:hypothetical protein HERIO_208 [Hepatospora eriocheir]|uniref:Uncharacterized protein n=1 Tax=Hepatospora eriocheir TaxID=1081669 RepID=A0A1X0QDV5_9MICR|nr:hypothetical protein HERIO_208 [Hepatospora eriocheir]